VGGEETIQWKFGLTKHVAHNNDLLRAVPEGVTERLKCGCESVENWRHCYQILVIARDEGESWV
jgi:hypothetical protein